MWTLKYLIPATSNLVILWNGIPDDIRAIATFSKRIKPYPNNKAYPP